MTEMRTSVDLIGPFFRDPEKTVRTNIHDFLEKVAAEGQEAVRSNFPVGSGDDPHPGAGRAGVIGRVESMTGKRWALHAVISAQFIYPWSRGGRGGTHIRSGRRMVLNSANAQYRGGKMERKLHMFANVSRSLRSSRAVAGANLSRGIE